MIDIKTAKEMWMKSVEIDSVKGLLQYYPDYSLFQISEAISSHIDRIIHEHRTKPNQVLDLIETFPPDYTSLKNM